MNGWRHSLATIADAMGGRVMGNGSVEMDRVLIDSRAGDRSPGALFIALHGPRHDGHDHIRELSAKGVRAFVVREDRAMEFAGLDLIAVKDTLDALQRFAAWHRSHFDIPVIGITGSNGKTIVKEWLWQMFHREENIARSPGSWNSQVGVPLSVLRVGPENTLAILEAGISSPGEMEKLEAVIRPTIGVLTNIGDAHDEGFRGDHGLKDLEKRRLFRRAQVVIGPVSDAAVRRGELTVGRDERAFVNVRETQVLDGSCIIDLMHAGVGSSYTIPFDDHASIANAVTCIAVCLHLGRSAPWIRERLAQLVPVDMRMRTVQGMHGTTLIDDSYSLDKSSLLSALDHMRRIAHGRPMVAVLSDVAETTGDVGMLYSEVARALAEAGVQHIIGVGPVIGSQRAAFGASARFNDDVDALIREAGPGDFPGAIVLIKGARRFGFERIVERWRQHVHGTELEVDLDAVRHNLNHFRSLLAPGVRTMAMVKAFGYGSGALELARLFQHERVHYLGVAYADEGIELRSNGVSMPIMVMNPEPVAMETLHRFRLETEVYDQRSLKGAIVAARLLPDAPPVHLKLDTGMHRLGFMERELPLLLEALQERGGLKIASILTHMVASDDPAQDVFTRSQIAAFERMASAIGEVLGYRPLWHMANSAGISRWPKAHFDMVRMGIGLHGIGSDEKESRKLMHTVTLRTPIAQIKRLKAGETVGYDRRGVIEDERDIATLPVGYADGLSRRLGNGTGRVWINGRSAPIIGNVCMDMCMVDVTGIACAVGDPAVVFDAAHPLTEVARDMGTIPYEVLTGISQRVRRVYLHG